MKRKLFGLSCVALLGGCMALGFVATVVLSVILSNSGSPDSTAVPSATAIPSQVLRQAATIAAPVSTDAPYIVVTEIEPTSTQTTVQPIATDTETTDLPTNFSNLNELSYPLTITAQAQVGATQVFQYRSDIYASRTAAAERVYPTHLALTATAAGRP